MNKKKIILINIILLIIIFVFAEYLSFLDASFLFKTKPVYSLKKADYSLENLKQNMRNPSGLEYKKKPVLIYGCSYAYGFSLKESDSFGYKLSEAAKRPVYNFAISSKGLQDTLFLLENDKTVTPEPQYIFYVFINDHIRRMFVNCNKIDYVKYLTYKNKNGKLVPKLNGFAFGERLYLFGVIKNGSYYFLKNIFRKQIYDLFRLYLITIKNEAAKKYPDAKFIVLDYENGKESYLSPQRVQDLSKYGIEIVSLNKVFNGKLKADKYRNSPEQDVFRHPNSEAWDLVVKYLIQKYDL